MKADKKMWIIGLMVLVLFSSFAHSIDFPDIGEVFGADNYTDIDDFTSYFGILLVNGLVIFVVLALIAVSFSIIETRGQEKPATKFVLLFAGSVFAGLFLFGGKEFLWESDVLSEFFVLSLLVNAGIILAAGYGIMNIIPSLRDKKPNTKGGNLSVFVIMAVAAIAIAKYLSGEHIDLFLWQMPWFEELKELLGKFWIFVGMGVIYYLLFGMIKGFDKTARIVLGVILGYQAVKSGWDMPLVWSLGYTISLIFIWKALKGSGNWIACGMSFAISNLMGSVIPSLVESKFFFWLSIFGGNFLWSFAIGAFIGFLFDKSRGASGFLIEIGKKKLKEKLKEKIEGLFDKSNKTQKKWEERFNLIRNGYLKMIDTSYLDAIEHLKKDMALLSELEKKKRSFAPGSDQWNNIMFGAPGYPTIQDYRIGYDKLREKSEEMKKIASKAAESNKEAKKQVKAGENISRWIGEQISVLSKGDVSAGAPYSENNPVYSSKFKSIMGITEHTELEIRRIMEEKENKGAFAK